VELDASRRALRLLAENGVIFPEEQQGARRMLRASLVFGNRRSD
jgi:Zn-dependent membrane protease YugP